MFVLALTITAAALWLQGRGQVEPVDASGLPLVATGRVESVDDGDTLVFVGRTDSGAVPLRARVRLHGIDAPELAQRSGWAAREALRELTRNTELRVDCYKRDPRGRAVCRARTTAPFGAEDSDIELALLRLGLAWHYVDYAAEQSPDERARYAQAEVDARAARRGLWAGQTPMPPWQCRERLRSGKLCD